MNRFAERLLMAIVWRLPRVVVYWAVLRAFANATTGRWSNQEVPALTVAQMLQRWETQPPKDYDCEELELRATCGLG